jgi:hypothetical protein
MPETRPPDVTHGSLDGKLEFASVTRTSCGNPRLHIDFREE